jgi:hypothetical protein
MNKVYCEDCKHYDSHCYSPEMEEECTVAKYKLVDTYYQQIKLYETPFVKNMNNDCSDYWGRK